MSTPQFKGFDKPKMKGSYFDPPPVPLFSGQPTSPRSTESRGLNTALGLMHSGPQRDIPAGEPGSHQGWAPAGPGM